MKKKLISLAVLLLASLLLLSSCGNESASVTKSEVLPVILNQAEYVLSQNIFFNGYMPQYDGKETEKEGIYAVIQDAYNNRTRYYVWGYLDQTMCCDWQWEFVPEDPSKLPAPGSRIKVSGTYEKNDDALDDLWIINAKTETLVAYTGDQVELNMRTMSDTLERVQLSNMMVHPESFIGKEYMIYGRVASDSTIQDPYYDGSWYVPYESSDQMPAIGTTVVLRGTYQESLFAEAKLVATLR